MKMGGIIARSRGILLGLILTGLALPVLADSPPVPAPAAADLAPLDIKLPKPLFVGTPKNINSANLEVSTGKKRAPFMAPKDVKNVALKMDVDASDKAPIIGELTQVTDGDKEGADGSFVELGPGMQYAQIDLKQPTDIFAILVWHYHAQARAYHDVIVRVADDADFVSNVKTLFNNDHDNSSGLGIGKDKEYVETNEGKLIDAKGVKTRYVRLYSKGNTSNEMNHYIEVEVYGKSAK